MFEFKLQACCLALVMYISVAYIKETLDGKIPCNRMYDGLLFAAPWAIIFDGATAWTVNHMDIVPAWVNLLLHGCFFIFMNLVIILVFMYMVDQTVGLKKRKTMILSLIPGVVSMTAIIMFMKQLYYVEGKTTNYSMGISVVVCYASLLFHMLLISILVIYRHKTIERRKKFGLIAFIGLSIAILIVQLILPETLVSSLMPTIAIIALYVTFENPFYRRIQKYNSEMVTGFATLVENRDNSTGGHIRRTQGYVQIILKELKKEEKYRRILSRDYVCNVIDAAPMHDIGKISTPDHILQKPGKLTEEEYAIMKQHAAIGGDIIRNTFANLDEPEYQQIAYEVARYHHEKWNGRGYPDGLSGEDIPLHARIMAIADVFDAVSAKRCYRDAMPIEKCFKIIEEGSGKDFDPNLVEVFLNAKEEILKYYEQDK